MQGLINNLISEAFWLRLVFMVLYLLLAQVVAPLLGLLILLQFLYHTASGNKQLDLLRFSNSLGQFVLQCLRFLTYQTDAKPFPFSDWPEPKDLPLDAP